MREWLSSSPVIWPLLLVLGLSLGSFLNVLIYRLPLDQSLMRPGSRCPKCGRPVRPWENVPVLSYLLLGGRCRGCRAPIGLRYPVVEVLGAGCIAAGFLSAPDIAGAAARSLFLLSLVAVTFIDYDHRIIPDEISLTGIALGVLISPVLGLGRLESLWGALAGGGGLLGLALAYRAIRGIEGMGGGDIKLAAMLGAFLGWKGILMTFLIASFLGSVLGIALILLRRGSGKTALPFGTFLAPAGAFILLAGPELWLWYLSLAHPRVGGSW